MPRAGWCHDCGEWVWIDPEGSCPAGHGPECISHIYDAQPADDGVGPRPVPALHADPEPVSVDGVGEGPIPPTMLRFNWGAFMIPALWGLVYGVWPVVLASIAASTLVPLILAFVASAFFPSGTTDGIPVQTLLAIVVASEAATSFVRLWTGASGNRLFWQREFRRLDAHPSAEPRVGVQRFLKRQGLWAAWGALGLVLMFGLTAPQAYQLWQPYGLGWAAIAEPIVFLLAQFALAAWLSRAMQAEHPLPMNPAEDSAEDWTGRRE